MAMVWLLFRWAARAWVVAMGKNVIEQLGPAWERARQKTQTLEAFLYGCDNNPIQDAFYKKSCDAARVEWRYWTATRVWRELDLSFFPQVPSETTTQWWWLLAVFLLCAPLGLKMAEVITIKRAKKAS